jgi:type IV secretory pathway VirB9-like protein
MTERKLLAGSLLPALLAIGAPVALAQNDPRLVTLAFNETEVVKLHGRMGVQATIAFAEDEKIENVAVGDSQKWQITPNKRANLLFAKPLDPAATTNMTVVTDRRTYLFDLVASLKERPVYLMRFTYSGERTVMTAAEAQDGVSPPASVVAVAPLPAPVVQAAPTRVIEATPVSEPRVDTAPTRVVEAPPAPEPVVEASTARVVEAPPAPEPLIEAVPAPVALAAADSPPVADLPSVPPTEAAATVEAIEPSREMAAPPQLEHAIRPAPRSRRAPKNAIDAAIVESTKTQSQTIMLAQAEQPPVIPPTVTPSPIGSGLEPGALNFAWSRDGANSLLPRRIFDDGRATYLTWGAKQTVPTVLLPGADGAPVPIAAPAEGQSVVIDSVPARIVLRNGGLSATLENLIRSRAVASLETIPVSNRADGPASGSSN